MKKSPIVPSAFVVLLMCVLAQSYPVHAQQPNSPLIIESEKPTIQQGSHKRDFKAGASGGEVLGEGFGSAFGDYAEYQFTLTHRLNTAFLKVRYAREVAGAAVLELALDGAEVGTAQCGPTGGWGNSELQFKEVGLNVTPLAAGAHTLRLTVVPTAGLRDMPLKSVPVLDLVGNRADKNTVGHGKNVALYTGTPSRFFYATHELGDVFSAVDGKTLDWFPDHVTVSPQLVAGNINLDRIEIRSGASKSPVEGTPISPTDNLVESRQICVTKEDVVVSRIHFQNNGNEPLAHRIEIGGDCRESFDWRGAKGGEKVTRRDGKGVVIIDKNVFPQVLPQGLAMVIDANATPVETNVATPGTYRLVYEVQIPPHGARDLVLGCAIERTTEAARANLNRVLVQTDPLATNRADWERFYNSEIPRFECSDPHLNELYDFRWFLLKFSTAGGDLGLFKYPVVMEGRQAYQTYCCYSAPFMAFDMNWANDPWVGFGHIANMTEVAYTDGRLPWYASPRTNNVPLDHPSKSGLSLLPHTAWQWYQIHGDKTRLRELYPTMKKNLQWWIRDRDPDGNGLFSVDHQLETGMDDLHRRWQNGKPARYEAVDATSYAYLNLQAVAKMARELGETADANYFSIYAQKSANALLSLTWDKTLQRFRDRNPDNGELSDYNSICTFYPLMGDFVGREQLSEIGRYLLNPQEFWTAYPIPALSQSDPEFDPVKRYWAGPSWPAATSHVIEGFATSAKRLDRSLLPQAAELLKRAAANHLQPRADFYEHYDPFSGAGLSEFRDYMHSWWVDVYIRHIAGMEPQDDGGIVIDPLPMNLKSFALKNVLYRGHSVDVMWTPKVGLVVRVNGKQAAKQKQFRPGIDTLKLSALLFR